MGGNLSGRQESDVCRRSFRWSAGIRCLWVVISVVGRNQGCVWIVISGGGRNHKVYGISEGLAGITGV